MKISSLVNAMLLVASGSAMACPAYVSGDPKLPVMGSTTIRFDSALAGLADIATSSPQGAISARVEGSNLIIEASEAATPGNWWVARFSDGCAFSGATVAGASAPSPTPAATPDPVVENPIRLMLPAVTALLAGETLDLVELTRGGRPPYAYYLHEGTFPPGWSLDETGLLHAGSNADGVYTFTIAVHSAVD